MSRVVAFPLLILLAVRHANGVPVASWVASATVATASQLESSPSDGPDCAGGQFPNIKFLGHGYDIVKGNPEPWASGPGASNLAFDPGWAGANVIDMSDYSAGGAYDGCTVPNAVMDSLLKTESCEYQSSFAELGDAASYQNQLHVDAGVSAHGGWGPFSASFSASADYNSLNAGTSSDESIYFGNSAICQMYTANYSPYKTLNLTSDFRKAVATLPTDSSDGDDALIAFVGYFGTHYTNSIKMGAKASLIYRMSKASYSTFQSSSLDVEAAMSISFGCFGGAKAQSHVDTSDKSYQAFSSLTKDTIISCVGAGGQCPLISDTTAPNDWAKLAKASPTPIQYTLASIADLLTSEYFDASVEPQIADKQNRLYRFLADEYCTKMPHGQQRLCNPPARDGYWVSAASTTVAREGMGLAALNEKLYAAGGNDGSSDHSSVEAFNPSTNQWQAAPSMSSARNAPGLAVLNGKLYAAGGQTSSNSGVLSTVEVFDPSTNSWQAAPSMSSARFYCGLAALNGKLYAAGGNNGTGYLSTVEVFDPSANQWQAAPSMSSARYGLGLAALNGKLYAAGGNNENGYLSTVEVFNPSTNSWQAAPSMSSARNALGLAVLNGKLYAAGGQASPNSGFLSTVEVFDPSTNSWQAAPSMPTARGNLGLAALDGKLYAAGGQGGIHTVERFWNASAVLPAAGAGEFLEYAGANCYSGHGGTEIDDMPTTVALAACAASCRATAACECFTYDAAASQCWRRTACKPDYFEQSTEYDTYLNPVGYTKYSRSNAYTGNGAEDIDTDASAPTGLTPAQCTQRCDDDARCSCVTFSPSDGTCWKRAACVPPEFATGTDAAGYVVWVNRGRIAPPAPVPVVLAARV